MFSDRESNGSSKGILCKWKWSLVLCLQSLPLNYYVTQVKFFIFSYDLKFLVSRAVKYYYFSFKNPIECNVENDKMWTGGFSILSPLESYHLMLFKVSQEWTESLVTKELSFLMLSSSYKWQLKVIEAFSPVFTCDYLYDRTINNAY